MLSYKDKEQMRQKAGKRLEAIGVKHRVCTCGKPMGAAVDVMKHVKTQKYSFNQIQTCGNVWACMVCATKVTEKRRQEILTAHDKHLKDGFMCGLLTLTFPHTKQDDLLDLSRREAQATKNFKGRIGWKKFKKDTIGSIRGFEITHGNNGWHLHSHHLIFFDKKSVTAKEYYDYELGLYDAWKKACISAGLPEPSFINGVDLVFNATGDYVSKWGLDLEMTKGHLKTAKKKSKTPFQLLLSEDEDDNKLYDDFVQVFAIKRKQQLRWSNGLKAKFDIDVKTDEELAEEETQETMIEAFTLTNKEYYHFWINGLSHMIFNALENGGEDELMELIRNKNEIIKKINRNRYKRKQRKKEAQAVF